MLRCDPGATENRPSIFEWQTYLGDAYLRGGPNREGESDVENALAMARQRGERGSEALGLRTWAAIEAAHNPISERALELYQQDLALAAELHMRPLVFHCYLGCSKLYKRSNNFTVAARSLNTAKMYRDMGMSHWLNQAEIESRSMGSANPLQLPSGLWVGQYSSSNLLCPAGARAAAP